MNPDETAARDDQIRARVTADVMQMGTAAYWRRRAETFQWARPRPDDYTGHATPAELAERDRRLVAAVETCMAHAALYEPDRLVMVA